MNCPDCKTKMYNNGLTITWKCTKCGKEFDEEDLERINEE